MDKIELQALTIRVSDVVHEYLYKKEKGYDRVHFILVMVDRNGEEIQTSITSSNNNPKEVADLLLEFGVDMMSEKPATEITSVTEFRKTNEN